jgi:high-affinity iron transporter
MTAASRFLAWLVFPLCALSSFNLLADGLREALDPKMKSM